VHGDHVKSETVEKAITQIVRAEEMRSRAKKQGETARKAVEEVDLLAPISMLSLNN